LLPGPKSREASPHLTFKVVGIGVNVSWLATRRSNTARPCARPRERTVTTGANLADDLGAAALLIDGPEAWKDPDNGLQHSRVCERELNTPAKTGPVR
jgi:hypothetical protein